MISEESYEGESISSLLSRRQSFEYIDDKKEKIVKNQVNGQSKNVFEEKNSMELSLSLDKLLTVIEQQITNKYDHFKGFYFDNF